MVEPDGDAVAQITTRIPAQVVKLIVPLGTPVKPGEPLAFAPGGLHLMLYGLSKPLVAGQRFPLELRFEKAGVVRTDVIVKPDEGDAGAHRH
jgi:copper(I)-binding protein